MKLFLGLSRTDYQDVLRAVGLYIDDHRYSDVRIFETEEGIVLQGIPTREDGSKALQHETYLFTEDDLKAVLEAAYQRRQRAAAGGN